ncbi:MAG: A/G-specific adenine glycosylase [Deltaproteobacteria bacterium]
MPNAIPELPAPPRALARALIGWYGKAARELPWRGIRDPYAIWVSEVMLQQTQVKTVLGRGYYARFLEAFPTVEALARAPLPSVLARWSGLGYYARARSLHAAAKLILARGAFPDTATELGELPGFGPYTAAAVASLAFERPEPAIDGNALRVYGRLTGLRAARAEAEPLLRELSRPLFSHAKPSLLNQAVMDLGASLCATGEPACLPCPWREPCVARRLGIQAEIPPPKPAPRRRALDWVAAVVRDRRGGLLLARRVERGLFAGLWELPGVELAAGASDGERRLGLTRGLRERLGLRIRPGGLAAEVFQTLTHRELHVVVLAARATGRPKAALDYLEARFVPLEEARSLGLSSVTRKLLAQLERPLGR